MYKREALKAGLKFVASAPLVRSSYNAQEFFEAMEEKRQMKNVVHHSCGTLTTIKPIATQM